MSRLTVIIDFIVEPNIEPLKLLCDDLKNQKLYEDLQLDIVIYKENSETTKAIISQVLLNYPNINYTDLIDGHTKDFTSDYVLGLVSTDRVRHNSLDYLCILMDQKKFESATINSFVTGFRDQSFNKHIRHGTSKTLGDKFKRHIEKPYLVEHIANGRVIENEINDFFLLTYDKDFKIEYDKELDCFNFVNIAITTYNRLELTIKTIDAIVTNTTYPYVITVCDNNSKDDTNHYLESLKIKGVIKNLAQFGQNIGIAKASNFAWGIEPQAKYYLKFDNDILVTKSNWLQNLIDTLECHEVNGVKKFATAGYNFERGKYPIQTINGVKISIKTGNVGSACILIPKRTEKQFGHWCEDYGVYGEEDSDYWFRIAARGFFNAYVGDNKDTCIHIGDDWTPDKWKNEKDKEYFEFKDANRKKNYSSGKYPSNIKGYQEGTKDVFFESPLAKMAKEKTVRIVL